MGAEDVSAGAHLNPVDLLDHDFLVCYGIYAGIIVVTTFAFLHILKYAGTASRVVAELVDPYEIAVLRGGPEEATRVAVVSLIERGYLEPEGARAVRTLKPEEWSLAPIEQEVLRRIDIAEPVIAVLVGTHSATTRALQKLESEELILATWPRAQRWLIIHGAIASLLFVPAVKLLRVASEDKEDLYVFFIVIAFAVWCHTIRLMGGTVRTSHGDRSLRALQESLTNDTTPVPGPGQDARLISATFGLAALPVLLYPWVKELFPFATSTNRGSSSGCGNGEFTCGLGCESD